MPLYQPSSGGGTPAGSNTYVQYNDGGVFGGESMFTYNKTTDILTVPNLLAYGPNASVRLINTNDSLTDDGYFSLTYDSFQFGYIDDTNILYIGKTFLGGNSIIATTHRLDVTDVADLANVLDDGAGRMRLKAGTSTAQGAKVGGTLNVNTGAVGNVGVGEDDLITYSVPANTLSADGDYLEFKAAGTIANNANAKRIRVYFGSDLLFDTGAAGIPISSAIDWQISGEIIRTGATTQKATVRMNTNNATFAVYCDYTTPGRTLSGANTLKLTGEAVSNNDISQELMITKWQPGS